MASKVQEQQEQQIIQEQVAGKAPLDLRLILLAGAAVAVLWLVLYFSVSLQLLAGIVPILAGLYIGRRILHRELLHGALTALVAMLVTTVGLAILSYTLPMDLLQRVTPGNQPVTQRIAVLTTGLFTALMVQPFLLWGVFIATRGKQQRQAVKAELQRRGGRLENPGRVLDVEDLRGLPLTKFTTFVIRLFKKHDFKLDDYFFIKDSHADVYMTHDDHKWLLRCTVTDKVRPGLVQELAQKMRDEQITKGIVLTSTTFTDGARRWADNRRELVVIDGEMLMQMSES